MAAIAPQPHESQNDFIIRAHRELMPVIADPMQRNREVWQAWDIANPGHERERQRAEQYFADGEFEHKKDVCLWHEHESTIAGPDGPTTRVNDSTRLSSIVNENNLRIADTDAYTAIVDKHTLSPHEDDAGKSKPRCIGYAGPFRLGMIGRQQPRFAIFGDEHRYKGEKQTFQDRPRRSVEVLTLRANNRSYIDPIAAISEAPRLPLPAQYSADSDGDIEVYNAMPAPADGGGEPVYAGGSNTYLPGTQWNRKRKPEQFGAMPNESNPEPKQMLDQNDMQQIVSAILSTPQMKFIEQLMQQSGGNAGGMQQEPQQPQAPAPQQFGGMAPAMRYSAEESGEVESEEYELDMPTPEQYAAIVEDQKALMEKYAALASRYEESERKASDAHRTQQLSELHAKFPVVDLSAELDRCLYSAGAEMSDDQFNAHVELVESYASKTLEATPMVPRGEMPRQTPKQDANHENAVSKRSLEIYTASLASGTPKTSNQCWAEAEKEIAGE